MFAIGESAAKVCLSKLNLPKEYNLKKKNRKIYGVWCGESLLYLSDEAAPLKAKPGNDGNIFTVHIDSKNRIGVPSYLEGADVEIKGCITTIEVKFQI